MSEAKKIWLIAAASLILIGCALFGAIMSMLKWDFKELTVSQFETNNYTVTESFTSVSIHTTTAAITVAPSENGKCEVVCYEKEKVSHTVSVKDGTLVIETNDARKWYENIGFSFKTPQITVYLPKGDYAALTVHSTTGKTEIAKDFLFESIDLSATTGSITNYASAKGDIKIHTTTGGIIIENASAASLSLSLTTGSVTASGITCAGNVTVDVSTGKTGLYNITCQNLISNGSTGDLHLHRVLAQERFSLERGTGDITLKACDAAELFIKATTGDVKGTLLSEKIFIADTTTGEKNLPATVTGGKCEIHTTTGDIQISILNPS